MSTAIIAAQVTGTLDQEDKRAMLYIINQENARRAALDPPGDPLSTVDNAAIRNSYEEVQSAVLIAAHASYIEQSDVASLAEIRELWGPATDAQRNACRNALTG